MFFGATVVAGVVTLFAMFYVGLVVKMVAPRIGWFDRVLSFRPGIRRVVYGLLRYLGNRIS